MSELKKMLERAISSADTVAVNMADSENPQQVKMRNDAITTKEAFTAVLDAINNRPVILKLYGG